MTTIEIIAKKAGVSRGTVDRVLHNRGQVKPETAAKVRAVMKELDFQPNTLGRAFYLSRKKNKIGVLVSFREPDFQKQVMQGINDGMVYAQQYGIETLTETASPDDADGYLAALKRLMDIAGSVLAILLLSPVMLAAAIGVKLSSPGPVFFVQERVGRNRKIFKMLKFRSMCVNDRENTGWSVAADPRKTTFGRFIRKTSIDELPQLFNVLAGQMSLVGPRPEIPYHVDHFKEEIPQYLLRQKVRPGMTGWAQVNGFRGDTSIEERVRLDLWYINHWCLRLDLKILLKTAFGGFVNEEKVGIRK